MDVNIKTTFSKARIESFYRFHFKKISNYKFIELGLISICIIIAAVAVLFLENTLVMAISLTVALVIALTQSYRISRSIQKLLKVSPPDAEPYYLSIKDDGVTYIKGYETKKFSWDKIIRICEIDECFYIYVGEQTALIFPKHYLKANEKEELRVLFTEKSHYQKYKFISSIEKEGVV